MRSDGDQANDCADQLLGLISVWGVAAAPYRPAKEFVEGGGHFDGTLGVARVTGDW
jgi:hypothetical protein